MLSQLEERINHIQQQLIFTGRPALFDPSRRSVPMAQPHYVRIHRGIYIPVEYWQSLRTDEQHLARIIGVQRLAKEAPVFSHISAAILHGLPVNGDIESCVHLTNEVHGVGRRTDGVVRHRALLQESDIVEISGMVCTSPNRTLLDLARRNRPEVALAAADGFLRNEFRVERKIDSHGVEEWRETMDENVARLRGRNGIRAARQVLSLADARNDSVLESVSHLQLRRLGFEVDLQVPVKSPNGSNYYVDFELQGHNVFGECDGKQKYTEDRYLQGMSAGEVVYREKRREDWICAQEQKRMIRWGYPDVRSAFILARRLAAFKVPIPRMPR